MTGSLGLIVLVVVHCMAQYFVLWDRLLGTFKDPYAFPQYDAEFDFSKLNANELKDISLLDPETLKRKIAERDTSSGNGSATDSKANAKKAKSS